MDPQETDPVWLRWAFKEVGEAEVPGPQANPRIVYYDAFTTLKATSDEVPWCSAFVCAAMENAGITSTHSAAARSWLTWGQPASPPVRGDVVVFSRGNNPAAGHVAFFLEDNHNGTITVLGGNQGNCVSLAHFNKMLVLGYRRPVELKDE